MKKRGQSSLEMAILLAGGLLFLTTVIIINQDVLNTVQSQFRITRSTAVLDDVGNAIESAYQQGVGAKNRLYVNFPSGITNISVVSVNNNNITIVMNLTGNDFVFRTFSFNVSVLGNFSVQEGSRWITVENIDPSNVRIYGDYV